MQIRKVEQMQQESAGGGRSQAPRVGDQQNSSAGPCTQAAEAAGLRRDARQWPRIARHTAGPAAGRFFQILDLIEVDGGDRLALGRSRHSLPVWKMKIKA